MDLSDKILKHSIEKCTQDLLLFRGEQSDVIAELIVNKRYKDLTEIFYKQGFLSGLKVARENREAITYEIKER